MARITDTVKTLLIANVLFFLGTEFVGDQAYQHFALWFFKNDNFRIWQVITHMFMHAGTAHIFFNMFALWMFGSVLEHSIGQRKFLFLYFSSGLGAVFLQYVFSYYNYYEGYQALIDAGMSPDKIKDLIDSAYSQMTRSGNYSVNIPDGVDGASVRSMLRSYMTPMVGASGAVFGVLAAFAIIYPNLPLYIIFIPIPIKAKYLIGGYFLIELFSGITGGSIFGPSNTAHWAHVGGAVIGFIMMWYWKKNQYNQNRFH